MYTFASVPWPMPLAVTTLIRYVVANATIVKRESVARTARSVRRKENDLINVSGYAHDLLEQRQQQK